MKGSRLLTDLGVYQPQGLTRLEENGGFFLIRLKESATPALARSNAVHRGRVIDLEGKTWREVAPRLRREGRDPEAETARLPASSGPPSWDHPLRAADGSLKPKREITSAER